MEETNRLQTKKINLFTKAGYLLLTKGNRYLNAFLVLAAFALAAAFGAKAAGSAVPAFGYADRITRALAEGVEFVTRQEVSAAWQQAWLSVFGCLFCVLIMAACVLTGIKMIKIILEFRRRGRTL